VGDDFREARDQPLIGDIWKIAWFGRAAHAVNVVK
jgi:hypothetical protein